MSKESVEVLKLIKELREERTRQLMDDFEERHGWAPDWDYELIRCNKTEEEIKELYGKNSGIHNQDEGWDITVSNRTGD